jgi:hypothetical protein
LWSKYYKLEDDEKFKGWRITKWKIDENVSNYFIRHGCEHCPESKWINTKDLEDSQSGIDLIMSYEFKTQRKLAISFYNENKHLFNEFEKGIFVGFNHQKILFFSNEEVEVKKFMKKNSSVLGIGTILKIGEQIEEEEIYHMYQVGRGTTHKNYETVNFKLKSKGKSHNIDVLNARVDTGAVKCNLKKDVISQFASNSEGCDKMITLEDYTGTKHEEKLYENMHVQIDGTSSEITVDIVEGRKNIIGWDLYKNFFHVVDPRSKKHK